MHNEKTSVHPQIGFHIIGLFNSLSNDIFYLHAAPTGAPGLTQESSRLQYCIFLYQLNQYLYCWYQYWYFFYIKVAYVGDSSVSWLMKWIITNLQILNTFWPLHHFDSPKPLAFATNLSVFHGFWNWWQRQYRLGNITKTNACWCAFQM